ncbi:unnamed protein product [Phaedon cochleariae]|uniref:Uncharacterized protein n=1 Tax=Phaedon cochleariae TaxID=80249 RepID=A0A9P0GTV7_PHACE|nr:unnamed protein product [Phaedon cochleariae]
MKDIFRIAFAVFLIGQFSSQAHPASNDLLDKATVNDFAINSVSEEKKVEQTIQGASNAPVSTIEISGITTGANAPIHNAVPPPPPVLNTPFQPPRAGSMFARLIDDIFQIPITVLQSVARLITNPFIQKKTPEVIATVA